MAMKAGDNKKIDDDKVAKKRRISLQIGSNACVGTV